MFCFAQAFIFLSYTSYLVQAFLSYTSYLVQAFLSYTSRFRAVIFIISICVSQCFTFSSGIFITNFLFPSGIFITPFLFRWGIFVIHFSFRTVMLLSSASVCHSASHLVQAFLSLHSYFVEVFLSYTFRFVQSFYYHQHLCVTVPSRLVPPCDNRNGWLGVKHQITYSYLLQAFLSYTSHLVKVFLSHTSQTLQAFLSLTWLKREDWAWSREHNSYQSYTAVAWQDD